MAVSFVIFLSVGRQWGPVNCPVLGSQARPGRATPGRAGSHHSRPLSIDCIIGLDSARILLVHPDAFRSTGRTEASGPYPTCLVLSRGFPWEIDTKQFYKNIVQN
jgi:hypothetical protein